MKKLGILFATIIMTMLFAVSASAEEVYSISNLKSGIYTYDIIESKITITDVDVSAKGDIIIPESLKGFPVTKIGGSAFRECVDISNIIIPDSVEEIGISAFYDCVNLKSVALGKNISFIDEMAFSHCTSLSEIIIPDQIEIIRSCIFYKCDNLKTVILPDTIKKIELGAFAECNSLVDVYYSGSKKQWSEINVDTSNTKLTNASLHCTVDTGTCGDNITYTIYDDGKVVIEGSGEMINYGDIRSPFYNNGDITCVKIENGVTSIGNYLFYGCENLTSVTIPNSITDIGTSSFENCSNVSSVVIPDSVTTIGERAFCCCGKLTDITIGNGVLTVGSKAFYTETSKAKTVNIKDIESWCKINFSASTSNPLYRDASNETSSLYINGIKVTEVTIPETITEIKAYSFYDCTSLENITLSNSVIAVGKYAFYECYGLKSIVIGENVSNIGDRAFKFCSNLTNMMLGNNVVSIGKEAFYLCGLTNIVLPDETISIGDYAFYGCKLESIMLGNNLRTIAKSAFLNCYLLKHVYVVSEEKWEDITIADENVALINATRHYVVDFGNCGDTVDYEMYDDGKVVISGEGDMSHYSNYSSKKSPFNGNDSITSIIVKNGVTSIGSYAFYNCKMVTTVSLPNSIKYISNNSFASCHSLININFPNSIEKIYSNVFSGCYNLLNINLPNNMISIDSDAFDNTGYYYDENNWDNGVLYIDKHLIQVDKSISGNYKIKDGTLTIACAAFDSCYSLTDITIPEGVLSINDYAFLYCEGLENLIIPGSVISIGDYAFAGCANLVSVSMGDNVIYIGNDAFGHCINLEDITISNSVKSIKDSTFIECVSLKSIKLGDNVKSIGMGAFYACSEIDSILVPKTLENIELAAFDYCNSLENVYYAGSETEWLNINIDLDGNAVITNANIYYNCCLVNTNYQHIYSEKVTKEATEFEEGEITYICKCGDTYSRALAKLPDTYLIYRINDGEVTITDYIGAKQILEIPGTIEGYPVVAIEDNALRENLNFVEIHIPDSVTYIGDYAFAFCDNLKTITMPKQLMKINDGTFYGCDGLQKIVIGDLVTEIGEKAFYNCRSLSNITLGSGLQTIKARAFGFCTELSNVQFQNGLKEIDEFAFWYAGLVDVILPNSVTDIGKNAFDTCNSMKSIVISNNITVLEEHVFSSCYALESIVIPNGVTKISENAFWHCSKIETIFVPTSVTDIDKNAFYKCTGIKDVYYGGTEYQWNLININSVENDYFINANIHFEACAHNNTANYEKCNPTCIQIGYTAGVYCNDCKQWLSGHKEIAKLEHNYKSKISKEATHTEYGTLTYTCECGDTYDELIAKLEGHTYVSTITKESTHLTEGTLTYTCECGDTYDEPIAKIEVHTYISEVTKEATHIEEGVLTYTCECGDSYTESIEKIEEHTYIANMIDPTCSEKGYTLNVCECGDSYISDYVGMIAHSYAYSIIKLSTHISEGLGRYTCSECGAHYDEPIAKTKEHSYISTTVDSTCTEQGYTLNECECGDSYKTNYLAKTDHNDSNSDGVCDDCGHDLTENCLCNCHKGGIAGFFFKLILFFQKIFKTNQICEGCGIRHY